MILTACIGNTTTGLALKPEEKSGPGIARAAFATVPGATKDDYALKLHALLTRSKTDPGELTGAILASVVPQATGALALAIEELTGGPPLLVGAGLKTGLDIRSDLHVQLGADMVCACVGALLSYPTPLVVVDFGTAITFSLLKGNTYAGCVIAPGLRMSLDALSQRCAGLPHISPEDPEVLMGRNTVDAMRAGAVYGYAALVDGILDRIEEGEGELTVVATGDDALPVCAHTRHIQIIEPDLPHLGLWYLYRKNTGTGRRI